MTVDHFDQKTGKITLKFASKEDYQKLNQLIAERMAAYGNYALARRMAGKAGVMKAVPTQTWLEKALEATAKQAEDEKYGEISANYRFQAAAVATMKQKGESAYEASVRRLKRTFGPLPKNPKAFFEHFREARSLKPNQFEPFYFVLIYSFIIAKAVPELLKEGLEEARLISPIQTFNCLLAYLSLTEIDKPEIRDEKEECVLREFSLCFPSDAALAERVHDFTTRTQKVIVKDSKQLVTDLRSQFTQHLEKALHLVRVGDLSSAREEFSVVSCYDISDKRPYMYLALIDLKEGDFLSALKQITDLGRTIQPNDKAHCFQAARSFWSYFLDEKTTTIQLASPAEAAVLKALLKMFRSDSVPLETLENFRSLMLDYLESEAADPLWAKFAIDLVLEYNRETEASSSPTGAEKNKIAIFIELSLLVPSFLYIKLSKSGADLSEFDGFIGKNQKGEICFFINIIVKNSSPSSKPVYMTADKEIEFLKDLLMETYAEYCSLFLRIGGSLDDWNETLLSDELDPLGSLEPSLISALLERYDAEGAGEQKAKLIDWMCRYFSICPESKKKDFTRFVLRWQLDQPIPCIREDSLAKASIKWVELVNQETELGSPLGVAFKTWTFIHNEAFDRASDCLAPFFQNWDTSLEEELDPIALRALCLARVLLKQNFVHPKMLRSFSGRELELVEEAFSMIAREGVIVRYSIPNKRLSKEMNQKLYRLYLGQKKGESDLAYKERLEKSRIPDFANLRQTKRFKEAEEEKSSESDPSWAIPILRVDETRRVRSIIEETLKHHQIRMEKNREIAKEKPTYSQDPEFIDWVTKKKDLIAEYIKTPRKIEEEINEKFPKISRKGEWVDELSEKAKHEEAFQKLKKETPPAEKKPEYRFSQLIKQTAELIERATSSKRSEESFDLFVMDKGEAQFLMQLIYEWGLKAWGDRDLTAYLGAFHGPETHIWGKGPRIAHFNAGIYISGKEKPINVHIFYP